MKKELKEKVKSETNKEERTFTIGMLLAILIISVGLIFCYKQFRSLSKDSWSDFESTVEVVSNLVTIITFPTVLILFINQDRDKRLKNIRKWKRKELKLKKDS